MTRIAYAIVRQKFLASGHLPAAAPIAATLAENSLKLIALRGLLEKQLQRQADPLAAEAVQIMQLMDELL